ncbi:hypothetical protein OA85_04370 [Flavobacterium sp. AED]|nr:hypothetical protein OA85_04370 [Flavobacterium sp. AED]
MEVSCFLLMFYYRIYFASSNHLKLGAILPFQTYDQIHFFKETTNGLSLQCFMGFAIEAFFGFGVLKLVNFLFCVAVFW